MVSVGEAGLNMTAFQNLSRGTFAITLLLALSACGDGGSPFSGMFGGDKPTEGVSQALPPPPPDERGVVTYATYQVMIARDGDTIPDMAARVGLSAEDVARHNGLPVSYTPRAGEVLALPSDVGGTPVTTSVWSPEIVTGALDAAGTAPSASAAPASAANTANPFNNGQGDTVVDPLRHRVAPGETAFSIARRYDVSVTALASWNGLDNEMTVRENQELLIPVVGGQPLPQIAAVNDPGTPSVIAPPPSADDPLPEDQNIDDTPVIASPNLIEEIAPAPTPAPAAPSPQGRLLTPVAGGSVLRGYDPNGASRNEGIDFAAAAGTSVMAAEGGEVALISESLGGLGTIVLIRHPDDLMTVYGRVSNVSLQKGDRVTRGQKIGEVAPGDTPNVHFEVRRGTASVDPNPFLTP
ncbi:MAG: LysM peptidoglycan-binding domain-containing M23 family metallopeptidase [Pseudomonadota bacterium]